MSWVTITTVMPWLSRSWASVSRLSRCITTSSAVTGSSAMMTAGLSVVLSPMQTRWRIPPESSCGYILATSGDIPTDRSAATAISVLARGSRGNGR